MQYAHPYYPRRVKDKLLHGPAHAGRTGRQPTTPEAWTRTIQRQARENSPVKNPFEFDGSVTHSTGTVRALPGGSGGLTGSSSRLGVILDS
jgi:hypothetical protein